jgi:DNA invertase Pin-like site-specific DNA recombinase
MVLKRRTKLPNLPATRLVGYARVSTEDQKLDLQVDALRRAGVMDDNLHIEKKSAASKSRPALEHAMKDLREGDTLVVWRLDRLARNMRELYARLDQIADAGASFKSLTEQFDFSTATGKLILGLFAIVAEFERQLTIERTKAGIEAFKSREGGWQGAPTKLTADKLKQIKAMRKNGMTIKQIAAKLKVSESIIYTRLRDCKKRKVSK